MGFRRDSSHELYEPLAFPEATNFRLPDTAFLSKKRERAASEAIANSALDSLRSNAGPEGGVNLSEALGRLEYHFLSLGDGVIQGGALVGARGGYIIGTMENGSGVARDGHRERHYASAMMLLAARLPMKYSTSPVFEFAMESGYYLARSDDEALDALMEAASNESDLLNQVS